MSHLIRQLVLVVILIVIVSLPISITSAQTPVHFWDRTSGLPGWHNANNWTSGLPSSGDVVYFRNPTNGTVYIESNPGVTNVIFFNYSSNTTGHVNAKIRGFNGHGLYGGNIVVGSNVNRTAFLDLDRGDHTATSVFQVNLLSRLDIRAASSVAASIFNSTGTTNLNGGTVNASSEVNVAAASAVLNVSSGTVTTPDFNVTDNSTVNWNGGTLNASNLSLQSGGTFKLNGGTLNSTNGLTIDDATYEHNGGVFNPSTITASKNSTIRVGSGATLGGMSRLDVSSRGSTTTFSGPGTIVVGDEIELQPDSSLELTNGVTVQAARFTSNSSNYLNRDSSTVIRSGSRLDADTVQLGQSGNDSIQVEGTLDSRSATIYTGPHDNFLSGSAGSVTIENGGVWNNVNGIRVGDGFYSNAIFSRARLSIGAGGQVNTNGLTIGSSNDQGLVSNAGTLNVNHSISLNAQGQFSQTGVTNTGSLWLGSGSFSHLDGTLKINGGTFDIGSQVQHRIGISNGRTAIQRLTNGASLDIGGRALTVGAIGEGRLEIESGSVATSGSAAIGADSNSTGIVSVTGVGSAWYNNGNLVVGSASGGFGTLNIDNSGMVTVSDTVTVGTNGIINLGEGTLDAETIELLGGGALAMDGGLLRVDNFIGSFTQDGGTLSPGDSPGLTVIDGDYNFNAGIIEMELAGVNRGTEYDAIDVSGTLTLNGLIELSIINGFTAQAGDHFDLFDAAFFAGNPTLDFSNATLGTGLFWDTSQLMANGSLFVSAIPEPTSAVLFGLVVAGIGCPRRRRARTRC